MNLTVEYQPITELFRNAHTEGRHFLYEFEVYNLLSLSGSETPPKCSFIPRNGWKRRSCPCPAKRPC